MHSLPAGSPRSCRPSEACRCVQTRRAFRSLFAPRSARHERSQSGNHRALTQPAIGDGLQQTEVKVVNYRVERVYMRFNCLRRCYIRLAFFYQIIELAVYTVEAARDISLKRVPRL